jgi:peptidoglycan hydrolase-like protein with peptidoglycan-binding domain
MEGVGVLLTDGIYGRLTYSALIYALQIEEGVKVDGDFGPKTKSYCPQLIEDSNKTKFIYLLQYALYCNGYNANGFDGKFGTGTKAAVIEFQKFACLPASGVVGMQTWASLLVSTGDESRRGTICDCSDTVTVKRAQTIRDNGYKVVGRYLTGNYKITSDELNNIFNEGLRIIPIFETGGYKLSYFNEVQGNSDGKQAIEAASALGLKSAIIYFTVDFDAMNLDITNSIIPYFKGIYNVFSSVKTSYKIGIYGSRNVCSRVSKAGDSCSSFVSDMSKAFDGNIAYTLPKDWAIDQIATIKIGSGDGGIEIDNSISSGKDIGVSR